MIRYTVIIERHGKAHGRLEMALVDIGWTGDAKAQRRLITSSTITEGSQVGGVGKAATNLTNGFDGREGGENQTKAPSSGSTS